MIGRTSERPNPAYEPAAPSQWRGKRLWRPLAAALLLPTALLMWDVPIRQDEWRIDAVTGSEMTQTVWGPGIRCRPTVKTSPLEVRLTKMGARPPPAWHFPSNTERNFAGVVVARACGNAPPIYSLQPLLADFVAAATDDELRDFVRTMRIGTDAQRRHAVDTAGERALEARARAGP